MELYELSTVQVMAIALLVLWDLAWKGLALWRAAKNDSKGWFISLLIINSAGIPPIIYLLIDRSARLKTN